MHTPLGAMNGGRARRPAPAAARGRGGTARAAAAPRNEKAMEKEPRRPPPSSRTAPVAIKASPANATPQGIKNRSQARRDRKIALQQDVDKLRKKLRHEENVHRALERAFTRPLGALPRLPPFLPSQTLELLAEVAVLEEEVVRLEEQVVNFRQGLYREAIIITSMVKNAYSFPDDSDRGTPARHKPTTTAPVQQSSELSTSTRQGSADWPSVKRATNLKQTPRRPGRSLSHGDCPGKENQSFGSGTNSCSDSGLSPLMSNMPGCKLQVAETRAGFQTTSTVDERKAVDGGNGVDQDKATTAANKVSEELLTCLLAIFSQKSSQEEERVSSPSVSGKCDSSSDPYGVLEFGWRDIGRYKQFGSVDAASFGANVSAVDDASALGRRLKALLRKLSLVDLAGLSHQQRLAFWINTYNSCMMNAFLEHGAPTNPHMLVAMMPKASINVGGRVLSAMTIEHFILRLPYDAKHVNTEGLKGSDGPAAFGLEWPEPLVTFALSCGSWSSPAVRVYTAARVEEELEAAKREYLQAAVGVCVSPSPSPSPAGGGGLAIPKLLHWYLPDFAKDVASLVDWVCLQLPRDLQRDAVRAVEVASRHGSAPAAAPVRVLPYEFRFRYLLALAS